MNLAEVKIRNALGLHARASARLVKLASGFQSKVTLRRPDTAQVADGKSILGILLLAARQGTLLEIQVEGVDEREALEALVALVEGYFGEEG